MKREKIEEVHRNIEKETRTAWLNAVSGRLRIDSTHQESKFREKAKIAQERSYELGAPTKITIARRTARRAGHTDTPAIARRIAAITPSTWHSDDPRHARPV